MCFWICFLLFFRSSFGSFRLPLGLHVGTLGLSGAAPWPTLDSQMALLGRPWGHLGRPRAP
jgi:hypothetical protein